MHDDDDDLSPEELEAVIMAALTELLNIAAGVAELQATDESAEEIYAICDLVAEYYQIERSRVITEQNEDGSFTSRVENFVGSAERLEEPEIVHERPRIPGSIRTQGKPYLRVIDKDVPLDLGKDLDDEDEQ